MCAARAYKHSRDGSPRHIIEHQFKPARLEPMDNAPRPQPQYVQPQPLIISTPTMGAPGAPAANTKADMMEMMMMQNAQMHQMMMQQMMLSAIPKPKQNNVNVEIDDIVSLKSDRGRRPPSVHHHHYSPPPPQHPPMPAYTLPPIQMPPPMPTYYTPRYYDLEPLQQPKDYPSVIQQQFRSQQHY